jgi:plasmid stabilization system protein ParE
VTRVQYQAAAKADLIATWLQIADDSVERADEYISRLQEICKLIADQPAMGLDRPDIAEGVQSFPVDHYIIFYEQHERGISVLRVWHSAQDPLTFSVDS